MEPTLAIQRAIRARLIGDSAVTALVSAERIFDGEWNTENLPAIIIGEGNVNYSDEYQSWHEDVFLDIHIWGDGEASEDVKTIAGAVRAALKEAPWAAAGFIVHGITVARARFYRDDDSRAAAGVLSVDAILQVNP